LHISAVSRSHSSTPYAWRTRSSIKKFTYTPVWWGARESQQRRALTPRDSVRRSQGRVVSSAVGVVEDRSGG
jgi:hypothetical protein